MCDNITVNLSIGEADSLIDFVENEFIGSIIRDPSFENIDYVRNLMLALDKLKTAFEG